MHKKIPIKLAVTFAVVSFSFAVFMMPQTFAEDNASSANENSSTATSDKSTKSEKATKLREQAKARQEQRQDEQTKRHQVMQMKMQERRERLSEKKLQVCEKHSDRINQVMNNVVDRTSKHLSRITKIYSPTKAFYEKKELSVANYDTLVETVEVKKTAAKSAASSLETLPDFSCESDGPKADIQAFREVRKAKVKAFQAYRESVRTLIKAIRSEVKSTSATEKTQ